MRISVNHPHQFQVLINNTADRVEYGIRTKTPRTKTPWTKTPPDKNPPDKTYEHKIYFT